MTRTRAANGVKTGAATARRRVAAARALRREATPAEVALWDLLRFDVLGVRFRRQHGIGPFVVDFCCLPARLVIEVDGDVHERRDVREQDAWRTGYLEQHGFHVLRFTNGDVYNRPDDVLTRIEHALRLKPDPK